MKQSFERNKGIFDAESLVMIVCVIKALYLPYLHIHLKVHPLLFALTVAERTGI